MATLTEKPELENSAIIEGIGPIRGPFTVPIPEGGGVVEFLGDQGVGKSTALRTINKLLGGDDDISVNDDCQKGQAKGFGCVLTVGKSTRRTGQAVFQILEGRFSIADLADPGIADPAAADRHRIKALVQLSGAHANPSLFDELVDPDDRAEVLKPESLRKDDLVTMAAAIKRDLESAARKAEDTAENLDGQSRAKRTTQEGIDMDAECKASVLQAALEEAIREESSLKVKVQAHEEASRVTANAQRSLAESEAEYVGPTVEAAKDAEVAAFDAQKEMGAEVQRVEQLLIVAKERFADARAAYSAAIASRHAAESHTKTLAQWQATLDKGVPVRPDESELLAATDSVTKAREAIEQGALIRQAKAQLEEANDHARAAGAHRKKADSFRNAAKRTDDVLSEIVARCSDTLRVGTGRHAGRLVLNTDRGVELFAELSEGEKCEQALLVAIKALPQGVGELTIPQEFWQGLSDNTRARVVGVLKRHKIVAYTARPTNDSDLRAEVYVANGKDGAH